MNVKGFGRNYTDHKSVFYLAVTEWGRGTAHLLTMSSVAQQ